MEDTSENILRVAIDGDSNKVVLVSYEPSIMASRILEGDNITFYGTYFGIVTYESTMGAQISVPYVQAEIIDIN